MWQSSLLVWRPGTQLLKAGGAMCLVVTHLQVCNEQQQYLVLRYALKISDMLHDTSCQLVQDATTMRKDAAAQSTQLETANVSAITLRNNSCASSQAETAIAGAKCCCGHTRGLTGGLFC